MTVFSPIFIFPNEYKTTSSPIQLKSPIETFHGKVILAVGLIITFFPILAPKALRINLLQP